MPRVAKLQADLTANSTSFEVALQRARASTNQFTRFFNREINNSGKLIRSFSAQADLAAASLRGLFSAGGLIGAGLGLTSIVQMTDQIASLTSRVKNSTRDVTEFQQAFAGLKQIANQTGASLSASVDVFQRLSFVRDEISATVDDMLNFTAVVQKLGVISGATGGALDAGLLQLGQGLASNVLRAEEFNSIMENIPAVGKAIADEFGVTTGQLRNLVISGQVLSKDVFQAILNQSAKVNEQFGQMQTLSSTAAGAIKNDFLTIAGAINQSTGFTEVFVAALKGVGTAAKAITLGVIAVFDTFVAAIQETGNFINNLINGLIISPINSALSLLDKVTPGDMNSRIPMIPTSDAGVYWKKAYEDIAKAGKNIDVFGSFEKVDDQNAKVKELSKNYKDLANAQAQSSSAGKSGVGSSTENLEKQIDATRRLDEANDRLAERERNRRQAMDQLAATFESGFEDAILQGKKLNEIVNGILADITKLLLRRNITEPLFSGLTASGGLFDSIGKTLFGGLPSFAVGTSYVPHDMTANIHKGEMIIPAREAAALRAGRGGGGGNVVVNVVNNAGAKVSTSSSSGSGGTELQVMIDQAVAQNIAKPGSLTSQALSTRAGRGLIRR